MLPISYSAPGKVILFGEHAVVYGQKAISTAISLRIYATIKEKINNSNNTITFINNEQEFGINQIELNDLLTKSQVVFQDLEQLYNKEKALYLYMIKMILDEHNKECQIKFFEKISKNKSQYEFSLQSDIPVAKGLGSSAAFSTASISHWITYILEIDFMIDYNLIYSLVQQIEAIFHGTPSGIDANTVIYGKTIQFQSGEAQKINNTYFDSIQLYVIDSSVPKSTKQAVSNVRQLKQQWPNIIESIMQTIGHIADQTTNIKSYQDLSFLVQQNQFCLQQLQINITPLDDIVQFFKNKGIACKITGGGLGGCCIAFLDGEQDLSEIPWKFYKVKINNEGLRQEGKQKL